MADRRDMDFTYSTIDKIFRLSLGECGDFSGAMYNGDFTVTLEEAQKRKHQYLVDNLRITSESSVLDIGCGWGPFIKFIHDHIGADITGVTLSKAQARACREKGFDVHVMDGRNLRKSEMGSFDAIVSLGAFEHFCSVENFQIGNQNKIYSQFFRSVADLLPANGRFYLQTMAFGPNMMDFEDIDIKADKNSDSYMLALMVKQFPGSWLPYGSEMILQNAEPYFDLISINSGRLDYIETIGEWRKRFRKFHPLKYLLFGQQFLRLIFMKDFRYRWAVFTTSPNRVCFEREIMDHYRIVFEKK